MDSEQTAQVDPDKARAPVGMIMTILASSSDQYAVFLMQLGRGRTWGLSVQRRHEYEQ